MHAPPLDDADLARAVEIARAAARTAGSYLIGTLGNTHVAYTKAPLDDVFDVDLESERIILSQLQAEFPTFGILSEEAGEQRQGAAYRWIVDPLDGSVNFQHGVPTFAVPIALASAEMVLAGVIYLPATDEEFIAIRGRGASRNGESIAVSPVTSLASAVVHIGELERMGPRQVSMRQLDELCGVAHRAKRIRLMGSSAVDLALVACGRADALIMHGGHPWDVDAGALLLREAGGSVSTVRYDDAALTVYSNGGIHAELLDALGAS